MSSEHDASGPVDTEADAEVGVEVPTDRPVLLFDGVCNLCTGSVRWIIDRDPQGRFRFASLQSDAGQTLLDELGLPDDYIDSIVLVDGDEHYTKSTAALHVAKRLGVPYSALYPLVVVPGFIRDGAYDVVANYRYRIFGKKDSCMMPTPEIEERFLE